MFCIWPRFILRHRCWTYNTMVLENDVCPTFKSCIFQHPYVVYDLDLFCITDVGHTTPWYWKMMYVQHLKVVYSNIHMLNMTPKFRRKTPSCLLHRSWIYNILILDVWTTCRIIFPFGKVVYFTENELQINEFIWKLIWRHGTGDCEQRGRRSYGHK